MESLSGYTLEPRKKSTFGFFKGARVKYFCEHLEIGPPDRFRLTIALLPNGGLPSSVPESEAVRLCQKCMDRYKTSLVPA